MSEFTSRQVELFLLKAPVITSEIRSVLSRQNVRRVKSELELVTDKLVTDHISQIDFEIQANAERMAEFYKIFYMLENDIRVLVSEALEDAEGSDWFEKCVPQAVKESADKNRTRELNEGLAPRSERLIDYTTFGELGEIIKNNWDNFSGIFSNCTMNRVLRVINRLNLARGPIAHCGDLLEDDVVRLKLTVRDWYKLME